MKQSSWKMFEFTLLTFYYEKFGRSLREFGIDIMEINYSRSLFYLQWSKDCGWSLDLLWIHLIT